MAFEYLAQYTTFETVEDMDTAVENHMAVHYYDLTESERAIVFKLASHALEHPGACHLKAATIAAALEISKTSTLQEIYNNAHAEKEAHKEYMNEYQVMLLDFMNSLPLADNLKDELHKVVLATQVQNTPEFIKAKNVLFKIAMDIKEGILTVTSTLRAVFAGTYNKAVERSSVKLRRSASIDETADRKRQIPFYNWLVERDSCVHINSV
ncbi:hypothetical protein MHI22_08610 [Lysinibacillus sp. FSL L8-0312]|uniref:hypothetical protein n=1 Tax=Lysinibacillus sp. FSL L8-0312 TaxID=2921521 RepID=UPI0030F7EED2